MKKIIALSVIICLIFSLMVFVSCTNETTDPKDTGTTAAVTTEEVTTEEVTTEEVTTEEVTTDDPTPTPTPGGNEGDTPAPEDTLAEGDDDQTEHVFNEPHPVY